ncbi:MAG: hypothetical protein SFV81_25970 [Pirellulaceae bacterium]|nr:hypothetical protein [Pirellulaceae bacterium]
MSKAKISLIMYVMLLALSTGCAAWTDKSKSKDSKWSSMQFWKKPYQKPSKVAAIWTHDILAMSGKPPTRGFGGRLYFYNDKSQTIPVDGELVVHGYEEVRIGLTLQTEKTKADKTFMFTAEQFTEHFGSSDLGASYSIWIPWDAADGVQKEITLIPTFKGKDGTILQGEPAKLVLPGRKLEDPLANAAIQHVSIQQSQTPTNMGPLPQLSGLRTTTISVPGSINRGSERSSNPAGSASSVVVHESNYNGQQFAGQSYNAQPYASQPTNAMNGNMMYASSPAARANAMLAAYAQGNANPMGSMPNAVNSNFANAPQQNAYQLSNGVPFPSTMPNAVAGQGQVPNQYPMQYNQPATTGASFQMPNSITPATLNQPMTYPQLPTQGGSMQSPSQFGTPQVGPQGRQLPTMNNQLPVNSQLPVNNQLPTNNQLPVNNLNPGFAAHAPLPAGAVEAAFASTPQFQPLGQARMSAGQVQPAGFSSASTFNAPPAVVTSGLGQGQLPVQPGQQIYQR